MPIYYESRIARLGLNAAETPKLDAEFDEITKWAAIKAVVGDPKRVTLIAADLVTQGPSLPRGSLLGQMSTGVGVGMRA